MTSILTAVIAVHPRVCGVEGLGTKPPFECPGSPPRVRGRGGLLELHETCHRFTPACAG